MLKIIQITKHPMKGHQTKLKSYCQHTLGCVCVQHVGTLTTFAVRFDSDANSFASCVFCVSNIMKMKVPKPSGLSFTARTETRWDSWWLSVNLSSGTVVPCPQVRYIPKRCPEEQIKQTNKNTHHIQRLITPASIRAVFKHSKTRAKELVWFIRKPLFSRKQHEK